MSRKEASKPLVAREYLRVSQDKDGTGKSLDQQEAENHEAFERQGWAVHPEPYREPGVSASRYARKARDQFARLIVDLEAGTFDADILAIWESSRGSRRLGEWAHLMDLCEDRGVRIFVTTHQRLYDPSLPRDRRSMGEDAVDAEYESAKTSERIKRHVVAAANAGRVHGKNLYGYQRHYVQGPRGPVLDRIVKHPEQAPIVEEAARRVLDGETYYSIAQDFNRRKIPVRRPAFKKRSWTRTMVEHVAGKPDNYWPALAEYVANQPPGEESLAEEADRRLRASEEPADIAKDFDRRGIPAKPADWGGAAIRQMLSMPAYAGKRQHQGKIVADAVWPALIEPDDWERLQALLFRPERRRNPNMWTVRYLCTGIVVCGVCGAGMRVGKQNRGAAPKPPDPDKVTKKEYRAALAEREEFKRRRREECICSAGEDDEGVPGAMRCPWHYRTYTCSALHDAATGAKGFHVAMRVEHLDHIVTELVIARLEQPDFLALADERESGTDDERRRLLDQIEADKAYLENVKEQAAQLRDLSIYIDQQSRIQPQIDAALRKLEQLAAVDPAVLALANAESVRATWKAMDVVDKRRVISALAVPQVLPAGRRGRRGRDFDRVVPGWR